MHRLLRIVIIEDEPPLLRELCEAFPWRSVGCEVVGTAGTALEGKALIEELKPDLVITDILLPDSDGLCLLKETMPRSAIVITGHSQISYAQEAIRCGAVDFLMKPLDDQELREAIRRASLKITPYLAQGAEFDEKKGTPHSVKNQNPETVCSQASNPYVYEARMFIRRRYRDSIGLLEAAEDLGISEGYLAGLFKAETGQTFIRALTEFRLNAALSLLADPRYNVAEAALGSGFNDPAYFSKLFRRYFGISPSQFRDQT